MKTISYFSLLIGILAIGINLSSCSGKKSQYEQSVEHLDSLQTAFKGCTRYAEWDSLYKYIPNALTLSQSTNLSEQERKDLDAMLKQVAQSALDAHSSLQKKSDIRYKAAKEKLKDIEKRIDACYDRGEMGILLVELDSMVHNPEIVIFENGKLSRDPSNQILTDISRVVVKASDKRALLPIKSR